MGYRGGSLTEKQQQIVEWQQRWTVAADLVGPEYADWIARHRELCGQTAVWPPPPPTGPASSYTPPPVAVPVYEKVRK